MCSEIWAGGQELIREKNCWCPLGSELSPEDSAKAFEDLGRQIWAKMQEAYAEKKRRATPDGAFPPDLSRAEIQVEWKLW